MSTSATWTEPRATNLQVTEDALIVDLEDGRRLHVPLAWYPRLLHATPPQRQHWEMIGPGIGFHWPDVDEDLSVEGLLKGHPAPPAEFRRFGMEPIKRQPGPAL